MIYDLPQMADFKEDIAQLKIGLVSAGLSHLGEQEAAHSRLVRSSLDAAVNELKAIGINVDEQVTSVVVPGVLEIPLMAETLIEERKLDGVIGFALIVDGGVYRFEFVAQSSLDALNSVSLRTKTPVASCMLTPATPKSPETQFDMLHEHLKGKGTECARALVLQILQLRKIKPQD